MRGRGLKQRDAVVFTRVFCASPPMRRRGLKRVRGVVVRIRIRSPLIQGRGLKQPAHQSRTAVSPVAPPMRGVD